ncbi:MAG: phosphoribosylformylglycinamidine synthase subunit PurS, partial [Planctomycetota bacterium]
MSTSETQNGNPSQTLPPYPDAWRVEVFRRPGVDDPEGNEARAALEAAGVPGLEAVRYGRGYLLSPGLDAAAVDAILRELLVDPVVDEARLTAPGESPDVPGGAHRVLVARQSGVMDPV